MRHWSRQILTHHPVVGWLYVPGLRARIPHEAGAYWVNTNDTGFRSEHEFSKSRSAGLGRLAVLGDSMTAGDGVSNGQRYTDRLHHLLADTEVYNFAVSGTGTGQQLLIHEDIAVDFDADAFLFAPALLNIERNGSGEAPFLDRASGEVRFYQRPYFALAGNGLERHNIPVPKGFRPAPPSGGAPARKPNWISNTLKPAVRGLLGRHPFAQYLSGQDDAWRLMAAILDAFIDSVNGKPVILAPLPSWHYIELGLRPVYLGRFREIADRHDNVTLIDVLPGFRALSGASRRACRFETDLHFTPLGHEVVAEQLAAAMPALGSVSGPAVTNGSPS